MSETKYLGTLSKAAAAAAYLQSEAAPQQRVKTCCSAASTAAAPPAQQADTFLCCLARACHFTSSKRLEERCAGIESMLQITFTPLGVLPSAYLPPGRQQLTSDW